MTEFTNAYNTVKVGDELTEEQLKALPDGAVVEYGNYTEVTKGGSSFSGCCGCCDYEAYELVGDTLRSLPNVRDFEHLKALPCGVKVAKLGASYTRIDDERWWSHASHMEVETRNFRFWVEDGDVAIEEWPVGKKAPDFRSGDLVKLLVASPLLGCSDFSKGAVGEVSEVDADLWMPIQVKIGDKELCFKGTELENVTSKFGGLRVGDRVKIVQSTYAHSSRQAGGRGVIEELGVRNNSAAYINVLVDNSPSISSWSFSPEQLEKDTSPEFKVGEWVSIKGGTGVSDHTIGDLAVIVTVDEDDTGLPYQVIVVGKGIRWYSPSDVKKSSEAGLMIGDYVKVVGGARNGDVARVSAFDFDGYDSEVAIEGGMVIGTATVPLRTVEKSSVYSVRHSAGDYVKVIDGSPGLLREGAVRSVSEVRYGTGVVLSGETRYWSMTRFDRAAAEAAPKPLTVADLRVGDRVEIVKYDNPYADAKRQNGNKGTVVALEECGAGDVSVAIDDFKLPGEGCGRGWYYRALQLKKIEGARVGDFKVGDYVLILDVESSCAFKHAQFDTGRVVGVDSHVRVEVAGKDKMYYFANNLAKLFGSSADEAAKKFVPAATPAREFRIGDEVEAIRDCAGSIASYFKLSAGDRVEVMRPKDWEGDILVRKVGTVDRSYWVKANNFKLATKTPVAGDKLTSREQLEALKDGSIVERSGFIGNYTYIHVAGDWKYVMSSGELSGNRLEMLAEAIADGETITVLRAGQ